jgi:hypothetical protein
MTHENLGLWVWVGIAIGIAIGIGFCSVGYADSERFGRHFIFEAAIPHSTSGQTGA